VSQRTDHTTLFFIAFFPIMAACWVDRLAWWRE
jgi:hypothetical protein